MRLSPNFWDKAPEEANEEIIAGFGIDIGGAPAFIQAPTETHLDPDEVAMRNQIWSYLGSKDLSLAHVQAAIKSIPRYSLTNKMRTVFWHEDGLSRMAGGKIVSPVDMVIACNKEGTEYRAKGGVKTLEPNFAYLLNMHTFTHRMPQVTTPGRLIYRLKVAL